MQNSRQIEEQVRVAMEMTDQPFSSAFGERFTNAEEVTVSSATIVAVADEDDDPSHWMYF